MTLHNLIIVLAAIDLSDSTSMYLLWAYVLSLLYNDLQHVSKAQTLFVPDRYVILQSFIVLLLASVVSCLPGDLLQLKRITDTSN